MKIFVLVLAIVLIASGCVTSPVSTQDAKLVPNDRVYLSGRLPAEGNSRVVFMRDTGFVGAGIYQHLFIDGQKAASLNPGEKVEFILAPGKHVFGAIPTDPMSIRSMSRIEQDLQAGRQYSYRLEFGGGGRTILIQPTSQ